MSYSYPGKIYKLVCDDSEDVYIGSTKMTLKARFQKHRSSYNVHGASSHNAAIMSKENPRIVLLENYPCSGKPELILRENHWYGQFPNAVNKNVPGRTPAGYYQDHRGHIIQQVKDNYQAKKEHYQTYAKTRVICGDCLTEYSRGNNTHHMRSKHHRDVIAAMNAFEVLDHDEAI